MSESLDEKTTITLPVKSWIAILIAVGVIATGYFSLKEDTDSALKLGRENAVKSEALKEQIQSMNMNIQSITDNVRYFREQYERDKGRR